MAWYSGLNSSSPESSDGETHFENPWQAYEEYLDSQKDDVWTGKLMPLLHFTYRVSCFEMGMLLSEVVIMMKGTTKASYLMYLLFHVRIIPRKQAM